MGWKKKIIVTSLIIKKCKYFKRGHGSTERS